MILNLNGHSFGDKIAAFGIHAFFGGMRFFLLARRSLLLRKKATSGNESGLKKIGEMFNQDGDASTV